ncbi:Polycomb group RING finger protein 5 [Datura stramonium]|uniref:Polycomb group RING finger protein 5 n=1 Tax=Datura stramonium TaxID=4076 RepID=A0ABS8W237_DATST|nr:Polycomb group RING finger protein 5 [Datura stramonium]
MQYKVTWTTVMKRTTRITSTVFPFFPGLGWAKLPASTHASGRPDHQVQSIMEILSNKRREYIARGLIKDKFKILAHEEADNSNSSNMLIDNPLLPPSPAAATSSRRKEKSISSLVDDQVSNQHNISSSTGIRRRGHPRKANAVHFQDSSKFSNVVELNNQIKTGDLFSLSGKATQDKQQVESSTQDYAAESSEKNKSSKSLDEMNDLLEPLNKLVTKGGVTLGNSKSTEPVPKINEHRVSKENVAQKSNIVVPAPTPTPSSSNNAKGKGKKGRKGRKKKEINNIPPPPPPATSGGSNNNEAATTSSGTRVHPIWFTLLACDNQECPSPLLQISPRYLKIKDVNTPASYIKRYLAKKLSLQSEDEVEVRMLGKPIRPALHLHHLADLWLRATPITEKKVKVGNSAKDFVMILKYARRQKP